MKDDLGGFSKWYATVNFSHFAIFNFLVCVLIAIVVSLSTKKQSEEQLTGLTLGTLTPEQRKANRESYTKVDVLISLIGVALMAPQPPSIIPITAAAIIRATRFLTPLPHQHGATPDVSLPPQNPAPSENAFAWQVLSHRQVSHRTSSAILRARFPARFP